MEVASQAEAKTMSECTRIGRIFEFNFFENEALYEQILLNIFDSVLFKETTICRLIRQNLRVSVQVQSNVSVESKREYSFGELSKQTKKSNNDRDLTFKIEREQRRINFQRYLSILTTDGSLTNFDRSYR